MMWCVKVDHNTGVYVLYVPYVNLIFVLEFPKTSKWKSISSDLKDVFVNFPRSDSS